MIKEHFIFWLAFIAIMTFFISGFIVEDDIYAKLFSSLALVTYFLTSKYSLSKSINNSRVN